MPNRVEPERPGQIGFRTNADDSLRWEPADEVEPEPKTWTTEHPWRQSLNIEYDRAADAEDDRAEGFEYERAAPRAPPAEPPPRGIGRAVGVGALVCGAALIGFLLARSGPAPLRRPAPASETAAAPGAQPVQVAQATSPGPAEPAPAASPPETEPQGLTVEVVRPTPLEATPQLRPGRAAAASTPAPPTRARPVTQLPPAPPVQREVAVAPAVAPSDRPVRVFVHISDPAQRDAADAVRSELNGLRIADRPVATPPVRLVANAPHRAEVRCLRRADCEAAREVARHLAQRLRTSVTVVDMSRTYGNDPAVRPGSLELWLPS